MAPHSSILAWKIPWTEGPGGLQSTGSLGVGHDWATSLYFFTFMHWRRKWQPTPVFLPGESQGPGCRLWGRTESDMTEAKRLSSSSSRFLSPWDSSGSFLMINIMYHWYCPRASFLLFFFFPPLKKRIELRYLQAVMQIMPMRKASHSGMARSWGTQGPSKRAVPLRLTWFLACVNTATHCPGFKDFFSRAPRFLNFYTTCPNF